MKLRKPHACFLFGLMDIKNNIMSYILSPSRREYRVKDLTDLILKEIGNM
jgi:hypothetical protein